MLTPSTMFNQIKMNIMKTIKQIAEIAVQCTVLLALYPFWFLVGLYMHRSRRDHFNCVGRFINLWVFPAFGRWWMPMIWLNWHY